MRDLKRLKIYVAAPYSNGSQELPLEILEENVNKAVEIGLQIWKRGHYPFIPHLTHYVDEYARTRGIVMDWREYMEWDRPWLEHCDAILYVGPSKGADLELTRARQLGLRVFYKIEEIPHVPQRRTFGPTERTINVKTERH